MSELTPFGRELRKLRVDRHLRLYDLGEKLGGVSAAFLSAIETGRKPIPDGFVGKLARALDLSASEVKELRRAKDRTRREVPVDKNNEDERELIAAFARRPDKVPSDVMERLRKLLLESVTGEVPFQRKRRGITVPRLSAQVIRGYAENVRDAFGCRDLIEFPIIPLLEWAMPTVDPDFILEIKEKDEMGDDEGLVPVGGNTLTLRIDVYDGACRNVGRDRFTCCHEFAHYLMHRKIRLARASAPDDPIYTDSEWQADEFAATLLMSPRHANRFGSATEMADACSVSRYAAEVTWSKYRKDGIIRPHPRQAKLI
jgi:Zn-dependent peptidase ImmA (M78 family)/transcriptional regulator with XRE-family HTH domain